MLWKLERFSISSDKCVVTIAIADHEKSRQSQKSSLISKEKSGVEKLTRSSLKGFLNRALFAYKNGGFASSFLLLGVGLLQASKRQICLSKVPLRNPIQTGPGQFLHSQKRLTRYSKEIGGWGWGS